MIFPTKYISPHQSLLGLGAIILDHLRQPKTITALWEKVRRVPENGIAFEHFVLSLDLLYALNAIDYSDGLLRRIKP
ncbi:MAG: hypothetical protein EOP06_17435 [Proteobacteria bacterium]|nr:MAG: hypothetical protein EOP06_17435 [Pseudomonadota bacterium]